jgi:transcriptional regulator with XRE-family HTH domain
MKGGNLESFKKRFLEAKENSGLRWIDIANRTGMDKSKISHYKNNDVVPEPEALYLLSKCLNVSMEWLTGVDIDRKSDINLLSKYHQLNADGKEEVLKYLEILLSSSKFKT